MGKGGGCFPSKTKPQTLITEPKPLLNEQSTPIAENPSSSPTTDLPYSNSHPTRLLRIYIVFYSMYGHVEDLARRIKKGVDSVEGVEGHLYRVAETLSPEILAAMHAPQKDPDIPEITAAKLEEADGFLFGFPTRFGAMAAQMKAFFDTTGQIWKAQGLANKAAGFFVSTGTQGGGQETTAWTAITQLAHHGMLFVPIGYTFGAGMFKTEEVRGGSPYGAGVYAGDGTRVPTETELALAEYQGKYMATVVKKLAI